MEQSRSPASACSTPIAVAKSGAEGGGSEQCLRNRLHSSKPGSSDDQKRAVETSLFSLRTCSGDNSLHREEETHVVGWPEVPNRKFRIRKIMTRACRESKRLQQSGHEVAPPLVLPHVWHPLGRTSRPAYPPEHYRWCNCERYIYYKVNAVKEGARPVRRAEVPGRGRG